MHKPVKASLTGILEHREGTFLNLGGLMISVNNAPAQLAVGDQVTLEAEYFKERGWTGSVASVVAASPKAAFQGPPAAPGGSRLQRFGSAPRAAAPGAANAPAQAPRQAASSSNPGSNQGAASRSPAPSQSRAQRFSGRNVVQEPQPAPMTPAAATVAEQRPRFDPQHPQDNKVKF